LVTVRGLVPPRVLGYRPVRTVGEQIADSGARPNSHSGIHARES